MSERFDFRTLYPDEMLVEYANHLLERAGSRARAVEVKGVGEMHVAFTGVGPRGAALTLVAPFGSPRPGMMFFRSLLRVGDRRRPANWLINGQSGTNTSEIVHLGESGPWLATSLDRLRAYWESGRGGVRPGYYEKFDALMEERMAEAAAGGFNGEHAEIVVHGDDPERIPVMEEAGPRPS